MSNVGFSDAAQLRLEISQRNRLYASNHVHVESCGESPVVVYAPENGLHGNFYPPAYFAIASCTEWMRRFDKIHAQGRSLPKPSLDPARKWRELDSSMSSDALLMNIFCAPQVVASSVFKQMLGIDVGSEPTFGWRARVPLKTSRVDRTEVDMRWGDLLVEAKLTESDFQNCESKMIEAYRDFEQVFNCELLPRVKIRTRRRRAAVELAEEYTQEWEPPSCDGAEEIARAFQARLELRVDAEQPWQPGYASYQLIRNVLAAHAAGTNFCVIHDQRRPDLREAWFDVMRAIKSSEMRARCKVLTWQEIVPFLAEDLREFLNIKYGIVAPGSEASSLEELERTPGGNRDDMRK